MSFLEIFREKESFGYHKRLVTRLKFQNRKRISAYETDHLSASGVGRWDQRYRIGFFIFCMESSLHSDPTFVETDVEFWPTRHDFLEHCRFEWSRFIETCRADIKEQLGGNVCRPYPGPDHDES